MPEQPELVLLVESPARLDAFVRSRAPALSRRLVRRLVAEGAVRVNGRAAAKGRHVVPGDRVSLPDLGGLEPEPDLPLRVLHVDDRLVALDKPGGMPSHALDPRQRGTAAAFLLAHWPAMATVGDRLAPGLVHRLDTGTSGILLAARTPDAFAALRSAFAARRVEKRYLAVVAGAPAGRTIICDPLAHDPGDRRRMRTARPGDRTWPAETVVEPLARSSAAALVAATIRTGVTHQVRAHLAARGWPVLGDLLYGGADVGLGPERHALHAAAIDVDLDGGERLHLEAPLPADLAELCRRVGLAPG